MNLLKQIIRIMVSASIGIPIVAYLNLKGILMMIFFFGIYIVVSMIIEGIWAFFAKKQTLNYKKKLENF